MNPRSPEAVLAEEPMKMGALGTLRYTADPTSYYRWALGKRGDPFLLHGFDGPAFTTADSAIVKDILATQPDSYDIYMPDLLRPLVGDQSLLTLSQEPHRRDRKLLMPQFHGERLRVYGEIIRELTRRTVAAWPSGKTFSFYRSAQAISMGAIVRVVFGISSGEAFEGWVRALQDLNAVFNPSMFFIPALRISFFGLGPWAKFKRARARADKLLLGEIAARRQAGSDGQDILSLMLATRYDDGAAMTDIQIRDELMGVLIAGYETTSFALSWAVHWILSTPGVLDTLHQELATLAVDATPDQIAALPYLAAVCNETLRLHPVIPDMSRKLAKATKIGDYELPKDLGVIIAISVVHEDPKLYPEPKRFRPERFLERKFGPAEFLPFGGGHKRCLGAALALYEMKLALATIFATAELALANNKPVKPKRFNVSLGPSSGVPIVYRGTRR